MGVNVQKKIILVVEDEPSIAEMLQTILDEEGYSTTVAPNGKEALRCLPQLEALPALVLCDVMMPEMDGIEMLQKLRADLTYKFIPVVLMSAAGNLSHLSGLSFQGFLQKPFEIDSLYNIIARFVNY